MADDPDTLEEAYGDPEAKPEQKAKDSKPWLDLIVNFDKAGFKDYQERADTIDKLYADADRLASKTRDAEFQMFWANIQVLKPSIYSRPPVPVVVPRFRDRKALPRLASELLERTVVVTFDIENIDGVMLQVRDDMAVLARGCAWLRYEKGKRKKYDGECVPIEWVSRRDFAHDPARAWKEVDWVAKRSWLTKSGMKDRFKDSSGDEYLNAAYEIRKDEHGNDDSKLKAGVWEIWSKSLDKVVWVSEGCEKVLDEGEPHLELEGFFPCPQPAYGTVQRGSLIPVPDFVYYQDQISEINALTNRIAALSDSLKLKGFYPAGAGELGDAIEAAVKKADDGAILIPIANWAMLGGATPDKMIVWLPIDMVAKTVRELVDLRKQLIDDVYQVTGLSDIMRGATDARETLGAQELKSQYGSIRVRDRQAELVRFARDITRIAAEIMAENFSQKTMLAMSQMEIPTNKDISAKVAPLEQKGKTIAGLLDKAKRAPQQLPPQVQEAAARSPEKAQELIAKATAELQQIEEQVGKLTDTPTIEQVMDMLREQRTRPFMLDIETDSTIAPDENAQKQRATEFVTATGGFLSQVIPLVQAVPQAAPLAGSFLKYVAGQFRAGRELEGVIDEFADQMAEQAKQPKPNPEADAAQAAAQAAQAEAQAKQQAAQVDQQLKQGDTQHAQQMRERETAEKIKATQLGMQQAVLKHQQDMQKGALEIEALKAKIVGLSQPQCETTQGPKPPSTSVPFDSLPPVGQAQVAAQAGIAITPQAMQQHANEQDAKDAAAKAAAERKQPVSA